MMVISGRTKIDDGEYLLKKKKKKKCCVHATRNACGILHSHLFYFLK